MCHGGRCSALAVTGPHLLVPSSRFCKPCRSPCIPSQSKLRRVGTDAAGWAGVACCRLRVGPARGLLPTLTDTALPHGHRARLTDGAWQVCSKSVQGWAMLQPIDKHTSRIVQLSASGSVWASASADCTMRVRKPTTALKVPKLQKAVARIVFTCTCSNGLHSDMSAPACIPECCADCAVESGVEIRA